MKKLLFLLLIGYSTLAFGQQADMPDFDMEEFDKKSEIAEWLFEYDMVFLAAIVACFFLVGVMQAFTTAKEKDWMERSR